MNQTFGVKELEKLSTGFLDHLPYGLCVLDHHAHVVYINRRQELLSAVQRSDVIGKCLLDSPALKANGLDAAIQHVLKTGQSWRGPDVEAVYRDNSLVKKETYRDEIISIRQKDRIVGAMILSIPVMEARRIDERLQKIDQELDAVFQVFLDGLMVIDQEYTIVRINKAHASVFGKNALLAIGKKCHAYLRNKPDICEDCPVQRCLDKNSSADTELQIPGADSKNKLIELHAYPIASGSTAPQQVILYSRDITFKLEQDESIKQYAELLRREVEHRTSELRAQNIFIDTLLDNLEAAIVVISNDYSILKSNSAFHRMFDLAEVEIAGSGVFEAVPELGENGLREAIDEAFRTEEVVIKNIAVERKAKPAKWIAAKCFPVKLSDGTRILVVRGEDITNTKGESDRIKFKEKMENLGLLARKIAHEINNPLEAILNRVCLLELELAKGLDEQKLEGELMAMQAQIQQISDITNSLLTFTSTSAKEFHPVDIGKILHNAILVADIGSCRAKIAVETEIPSTLPPLRGDEVELERCFVNMLQNAVDAIIDNGCITVRARHDSASEQIIIEISDTGVGIAGEILDKIFDPFYSTKKMARRVGLGLSISYGIIADHHGRIEVQSRQGHGTTFTVFLPVAE